MSQNAPSAWQAITLSVLFALMAAGPAEAAQTFSGSVDLDATSASGWPSASGALSAAGAAATSAGGDVLTVSGFGPVRSGTVTAVTVRVDASQLDHTDDTLHVTAAAPGCSSVSASPARFEPSATVATYGVTLSCQGGWTWSAVAGLSVSMTSEEVGGLLLLSGIDGAWQVEYVRLHVSYDNVSPVANAGADQVVQEGATVQLQGSASDGDGDAVILSWEQVSGPSVTLSGSAGQVSFTAPDLASNDVATLTFRLTASDVEGHTGGDDVTIRVENINQPPQADAGADQTATVGDTVTLSASGTSDPDGDAISYAWTQTSGPAATLTGATTTAATFQAANGGTYVFELVARDPAGLTDTASTTVTVDEVAASTSGGNADPGTSTDPAPGGTTGGTASANGTTATSGPTTSGTTTQDAASSGASGTGGDAATGDAGNGASASTSPDPVLVTVPERLVLAPGASVEVTAMIRVGDELLPATACQWDPARSAGTFTWDAETPCRGLYRAPDDPGDGRWIDVAATYDGATMFSSAPVVVAVEAGVELTEGTTTCSSTIPGDARVPVRFPAECGVSLVIVDGTGNGTFRLEASRSDAWPHDLPDADAHLLMDPVYVQLTSDDGTPAAGRIMVYYDLPADWHDACTSSECTPVLYRHDGTDWHASMIDADASEALAAGVDGQSWLAVATVPLATATVPATTHLPWLLLGAGLGGIGLVGAGVAALRRKPRTTEPAPAAKTERPQIVLGDLDAALRNEELVQFMNNASHDLASPLTPIRLQLALLNRTHGDTLSDKQKHALDVVKRNVEHMGLLVTDLKDAARLQAGRLDLFPEPMDLADTVRESCESFMLACEEKGVRLVCDAAAAGPVMGDAGRLTQVLYNLINNALKFTDAGGKLHVATRHADDRIVVLVRDSGIGMTAEDAGKLFQPFSQAHSTTEKKKGSGLGLFICKGIVEGHGGDIWCESDGPGTGSVFAFTLPMRPAGDHPE